MKQIQIAHISDSHFGTSTPAKIDSLTLILRQLNPDLVAFSGDITQRARSAQFLEAKKFCESLKPIPTIAVPGNHDIPLFNLAARFISPYFGFTRIFESPTHGIHKIGSVEVLAINSTDPQRHIQGDLTAKDHALLKQFSNDARVRIVMIHHPLDCAQSIDEKNLLKQSATTVALFETAKVDLVLSGHIHDPLARLSKVRYPDSERPMIMGLAGTCLSSRTRKGAPNSFNLISIDLDGSDTRIEINRYDLSERGQFEPILKVGFFRNGPDVWNLET